MVTHLAPCLRHVQGFLKITCWPYVIHTHTYMHMYRYMYVRMQVRTYVHTYVCIFFIYIHVNIDQ